MGLEFESFLDVLQLADLLLLVLVELVFMGFVFVWVDIEATWIAEGGWGLVET